VTYLPIITILGIDIYAMLCYNCDMAKYQTERISSTRSNRTAQPANVTMYPQQWATVRAYAKDGGYGSVSAALRRIVDEWLTFRLAVRATSGMVAAWQTGLITAEEAMEAMVTQSQFAIESTPRRDTA